MSSDIPPSPANAKRLPDLLDKPKDGEVSAAGSLQDLTPLTIAGNTERVAPSTDTHVANDILFERRKRANAQVRKAEGGPETGLSPSGHPSASLDDAEHTERLRQQVQSTTSLNTENQPRQRWVTATWYAAQEVQRNQEAGGHTQPERLNLVEAVKKVMDQDDNAQAEAAKKKRFDRVKLYMTYMDSYIVTCITLTATVYVLYANDIHFLRTPYPDGDAVIYGFTAFFTLIFIAEVTARSLIQTLDPHRYFLTFFFWLDIIAIISLLPDIIYWLSSIGHPDGINGGYSMFQSDPSNQQAGAWDLLTLSRSGRAARAGARAARIIRVLNFLQKMRKIHAERTAVDHEHLGVMRTTDEEVRKDDRSHLVEEGNDMGSKLDARISRYFVYCVGTMLIVAIVISASLERSFPDEIRGDIINMAAVLAMADYNVTSPLWTGYLKSFLDVKTDTNNELLYLGMDGETLYGDRSLIRGYRASPAAVLDMEVEVEGGRMFLMHLVDLDGANADMIGNIVFTTSVIAVLGTLTWLMSASVRRDVVVPMEGLMDIIQSIRKDPMKPITKKLDTSVSKVEEVIQVEQALIQLGALLQMGLGEAGAKIIRTSLKDNGLDVNVAGKIVQAIFGFCDIRNFTDCTEVLQADVVKLVNNVGSIVHDVTIENHGAPNKNIGDAFLLVWKPKGSLTVRQIAESALRSYVSIIIEMTRDKVLMRWAARHDIQERMPGYVVRLGCGLHYGWAIECAIGSHHKIDASYLSPHVNLSSRLEAATKQYGVPILLSGEMHGLMSDEVKSLCRLIDRVTVKGSNAPMYLYTYDVPSLQRFGGTLSDDIQLGLDKLSLYDYWKRVRPYTTEKFRLTWQMAMHSYLGGADGQQADWRQAKVYLNKCLHVIPDDGPAHAILSYIDNNCVDRETSRQPPHWVGYRGLNEK